MIKDEPKKFYGKELYDEHSIIAIKAFTEDSMSVYAAGNLYGISKHALSRLVTISKSSSIEVDFANLENNEGDPLCYFSAAVIEEEKRKM
jgi:hypothetical protein